MDRTRKSWFRFRSFFYILNLLGIISLILGYLSPFIHPETIGFIPLFGLAFPVIFICNFILMIFAFFRKSRWKYVFIVAFLLGFKLQFRTFVWGSNDQTKDQTTISLLSYNVHLLGFYNNSREEALDTRNQIFEYLKSSNADIYCFQEFFHQDKPTKFSTKDTLIEILNIKGEHERSRHKKRGRQNFGICILSKYPIVEKGDIVFHESDSTNNMCIYADIVTPIDTIRVYNVHLQSLRFQQNEYAIFDDQQLIHETTSQNVFRILKKLYQAYPIRAEQANKVTDHMRNSPHPVVVCGDFNDTPMSYTYNQFSAQLTDAFRNCGFGIGKTYAGKVPAGRIDYIFHSPLLNSRNFKIQAECLSDHYAINCELYKP